MFLHAIVLFLFIFSFKDIIFPPESKEDGISISLKDFSIQTSASSASKKYVKKATNTIKKRKIHKSKKKLSPSKDKLANALMGFGPAKKTRSITSHQTTNRLVQRLYGKEFRTFSPAQKKFIRKNLGVIQRITQNTLTRNGYPSIAVRTQQEGVAIVTFYLHSNGNISSLRLKRPIGYTLLDDNTLEVIRIAYKDYPWPKTRTKITFYVKYSLY